MSLKNTLVQWLTPGLLSGATVSTWARLLAENRFAVDPPYWPRALAITLSSVQTSMLRRVEEWRYGKRFRECEVQPPIFVLGFWRSGTTHLHNLLAVDERFAFPNLFQVMNPHTFLLTEALGSHILEACAPDVRPMDQVKFGAKEAAEDEFALASACGISNMLRWVFPKSGERYDRYLCLRDVRAEERERWRSELRTFVQKLSWKYQRPLVLKSPGHTARVRWLLELFPSARFIHIHRHPFVVYQSFRNLMRTVVPYWTLQRFDLREEMEGVIALYEAVHEAFLADRSLIPNGQFYEVPFQTLESDPIGSLRQAYAVLRLPDFSGVEDRVSQYLGTLSGYRKNTFPAPTASEQRALRECWGRFFEAFGYSP